MPILNGYIKVGRPNIEGSVSFMVDTGANKTVLMPKDALKLGVDFSQLGTPGKAGGVGAPAKIHIAAATVSLRDDDDEWVDHFIDLGIVEPDPEGGNKDMPSLLGRDIINDYRMIFDAQSLRIQLDLG